MKFQKIILSHCALVVKEMSEGCAALGNGWGFVDVTLRGIARPIQNQIVTYNGHKRKHELKYQSITTHNGFIANLFGPVDGRCLDSSMLVIQV